MRKRERQRLRENNRDMAIYGEKGLAEKPVVATKNEYTMGKSVPNHIT